MSKPKIGIRPVIDGRWGGVRESLENQTMNMAKAAEQKRRGLRSSLKKKMLRQHFPLCRAGATAMKLWI